MPTALRTFVYMPPLRAHTGGTRVLQRLARLLADAGVPVSLSGREAEAPDYLREEADGQPLPPLPWTPWDALDLRPEDIWLVPEGWVNALAPGLQAGARCLVYVQNWAYLFSSLPQGVDWRSLPRVEFLAVSRPVADFLAGTLGIAAPVLRPGIDLRVFAAPAAKPPMTGYGRPVVAYMPRKNKALVERVMEIVRVRNPRPAWGEVEWRAIAGLPPQGVAKALAGAHVFLSSGFPEGFSLPPLEAMACGCLPVGFSGQGGFDYMRQAASPADFPWLYQPWWPMEELPWHGNGLWVADADVVAAALAVETALRWWHEGDPRLDAALQGGQLTAANYSLERLTESAVRLWHDLAQGTPRPAAPVAAARP